MGRRYQLEHPNDPYDLTDGQGILAELAEEATDDAKTVATEVAGKIGTTASELAHDASDEAQAAYRYPRAYAGYTLRRLERRARARPLDTLATGAAIGFLAGALLGVLRRSA